MTTPGQWPADLSPDGRYTWNGTTWEANQLSPDGQYFLHNNVWHPLPSGRPRTRLATIGLVVALVAGGLVIANASNVFNTRGAECGWAIDDPASYTSACAELFRREALVLGTTVVMWLAALACAGLALVKLAGLKERSWSRRVALATIALVAVQVVGGSVATRATSPRDRPSVGKDVSPPWPPALGRSQV